MTDYTVTLNAEALDDLIQETLVALRDPKTLDQVGPLYKPQHPHVLITRLQSLRNEITKSMPKRPKSRKRYQMLLESVGNPDYGQYTPVSDPTWVAADSLPELRDLAEKYRDDNELGGGNWPNPVVLEGEKKIGYFSYNGRLWTLEKSSVNPFGTEIVIGAPAKTKKKEKAHG